MYRMLLRGFSVGVAVLTVVSLAGAGLLAQSTPAAAPAAAPAGARAEFARLLPPDALVYVRVANARLLQDEFWKTSTGRMALDPQFKPLLDQSFAAVEKAFTPVRERIGLSLTELLKLPQGEVGFAVLPVTGSTPAIMLMMEAADDDPAVGTLLERGRALALEAGWIEEQEQVEDVKLTRFRAGAGQSEQIMYVRRQGVLVVSTNADAIRMLVKLWLGTEVDTLADQPAFTTLDRLIGKAEGEPAHIAWFVDPINLVRASTQGNTGAQVGLAMLPALGLDGVTAVAGSFTLNRGQFEMIGQAYLLLEAPRSGVVELIALQPTEIEPEPWVFDSVAAYFTMTWDVERTYHKLRQIVDSFTGEGTFRGRFNDRLREQIEIDFETEVLPQLEGRFSFALSIEEPVTLNSRAQLFAVKLKDGRAFDPVLKKFTTKLQDNLEVKNYGATTYYVAKPPERPGDDNPDRPVRPRPAFCIVDDYLIIADRASLMEKALATAADDSHRLANSLDFKLIAGKARRYAGEQGPGLLLFSRPEEEIRFLHGLAMNERIREDLADEGERNPFFKDLNQALTDRPLPALEVLQQYYAPGGSIVVDEPTGVRYLSFVLRRE